MTNKIQAIKAITTILNIMILTLETQATRHQAFSMSHPSRIPIGCRIILMSMMTTTTTVVRTTNITAMDTKILAINKVTMEATKILKTFNPIKVIISSTAGLTPIQRCPTI